MQKNQQPVLQSSIAIFEEFEKRVKLVEPEKTFHKGKGDYLYYKREENPELKKLCFLPANKRPSEYDYIKTNTFYGAKESIHQLILAEEFSLTSYSVFTEVNGMIDEFFCIHTHIDSVVDIQMFTFMPERENTILVRDFKILIEILIEKYSQVSWGARKENTLNSIFRELVKSYKGTLEPPTANYIGYVINRQKNEISFYHKRDLLLPTNIWIDTSKLLQFQLNTSANVQKEIFASLSLNSCKIIESSLQNKKCTLSQNDIHGIEIFVHNNKFALNAIANEILSESEFFSVVIKGIAPVNDNIIQSSITNVKSIIQKNIKNNDYDYMQKKMAIRSLSF